MPKRYNTPHRSRVVKTRLSEDEYADFTARLAPYGISQSEFLRQAIRRTAIRPVIHVSAVNDELLSAVGKLTAEYGKIGGNLNQIARCLNEYGAPYNALSGEVRAAIADLAALKYEVLQKVGDAVGNTQAYAETAVMVECAGAEFSAKGRTVKQPGWRALDAAYRAGLKNAEPDKETEDKALPDGGRLPELAEGQSLPVAGAAVKEGKTTPSKHYTEDTLLSAMETAGKDEMPEDAERKGLGTPATRAGILEKLVSTGFLERKKSKKQVQLLPSHDAVSLITVLPEQLQSPLLTAEWEYRLGEIERGELAPEDFMSGISAMLQELVGTYQVIKGTEYLFTPPREVVGKCPRCGGEVAEMQKGFFCQDKSCNFAIWKNSKWWAMKRKQPTKAIVTALLKDGRARVTGLYSEKSGKTYDATVVLDDDGRYANFKLDFDRQKGGGK